MYAAGERGRMAVTGGGPLGSRRCSSVSRVRAALSERASGLGQVRTKLISVGDRVTSMDGANNRGVSDDKSERFVRLEGLFCSVLSGLDGTCRRLGAKGSSTRARRLLIGVTGLYASVRGGDLGTITLATSAGGRCLGVVPCVRQVGHVLSIMTRQCGVSGTPMGPAAVGN